MKQKYGYLLIVLASIVWGIMGVFGKLAFEYGIHQRCLPLPELAYSASIRLTVKLISILENNNLRVSWGSPRNGFKPDYHLL